MPETDPSRPKLVSVDGGFAPDPTPAPSGTPRSRWLASRWVLLLLAVLLLAAAGGLAVQRARVAALEEEVEVLSGQLLTTRSALEAYVERFAEVRESLDGLREQVLALDALVSADPTAPAPAPDTGAGDVHD